MSDFRDQDWMVNVPLYEIGDCFDAVIIEAKGLIRRILLPSGKIFRRTAIILSSLPG